MRRVSGSFSSWPIPGTFEPHHLDHLCRFGIDSPHTACQVAEVFGTFARWPLSGEQCPVALGPPCDPRPARTRRSRSGPTCDRHGRARPLPGHQHPPPRKLGRRTAVSTSVAALGDSLSVGSLRIDAIAPTTRTESSRASPAVQREDGRGDPAVPRCPRRPPHPWT